jgi:hypothetical protein
MESAPDERLAPGGESDLNLRSILANYFQQPVNDERNFFRRGATEACGWLWQSQLCRTLRSRRDRSRRERAYRACSPT